MTEADVEIQTRMAELGGKLEAQETQDQIHEAELSRKRADAAFEAQQAEEKLARRIKEIETEVKAVVDQVGAISPDLIAALQAFGDKELAGKLSENMSPMAILGGRSIAEVFSKLVQGTILEKVLEKTGPAKRS